MTGKHRKPSRFSRTTRVAAPFALALGLGAAPATAGANPLPGASRADIDGFLDGIEAPAEIRAAIDPSQIGRASRRERV